MKLFAISSALCVAFAYGTQGQGRYDSLCPRLSNASASDLLDFLNGVSANKESAWCITLAIHNLGTRSYEPAIPVLVKLLDFRRPQTPREKAGFGDFSSGRVFPAQDALEEIGKPALHEILRAIEVDSTPATARENAVEVWMEIHKYDEHPKAIALLHQELINAKDDATKSRLQLAIQKALAWCNSPEETASCAEAATGHLPVR
jgi:hypothetical protein